MKSTVKALKAHTELNDNQILVVAAILANNNNSSVTLGELRSDFAVAQTNDTLKEITGFESKKLSGVLLGLRKKGHMEFNKDNGTHELSMDLLKDLSDDLQIAPKRKAKKSKAKKEKTPKYTRINSIVEVLEAQRDYISVETLIKLSAKRYAKVKGIAEEHTKSKSVIKSTVRRVIATLEVVGKVHKDGTMVKFVK